MAAQHQSRPSSSASSSLSRPSSAHPQLHLPLSHHGLPRAPTSPESSYSSRSQRYEPLSKGHPTTTSSSRPPSSSVRASVISPPFAIRRGDQSRRSSRDTEDEDGHDDDPIRSPSHFFRLSLNTTADAPPSPPMTPFSPSAFLGSREEHERAAVQCCPRCRCSLPSARQQPQAPSSKKGLHQQLGALQTSTSSSNSAVQRARSMEELPSPVRRMLSTRSVGGQANPYAEQDYCDADAHSVATVDPAIQAGIGGAGGAVGVVTPPPSSSGNRGSSSSSFAAKFGKKIKEKLGGGDAGTAVATVRSTGGGGGGGGGRASRRVDYEEMEEVHWTEI